MLYATIISAYKKNNKKIAVSIRRDLNISKNCVLTTQRLEVE